MQLETLIVIINITTASIEESSDKVTVVHLVNKFSAIYGT
jgi:hypothetical protein